MRDIAMIHRPLPRLRAHQRGLSLVELMVGVTIGLFILAAATLVVTSQLGDNRRMLIDAQLQQDIRATLDIAARDLRRAAYWGRSWSNVWAGSVTQSVANPYAATEAESNDEDGDSLTYARSTDDETSQIGTDNNTVGTDERVGFRFNRGAGTVEMMLGNGTWQTLTDASVMRVTQFDITFTSNAVPLPCGAQCQRGPSGCRMDLVVRNVALVMSAEAVHDASVKRSARTDVRMRNDLLVERSGAAC